MIVANSEVTDLNSEASSLLASAAREERVRMQARSELGRELLGIESRTASASTLDPLIREIAILTVLRRSKSEVTARSGNAAEEGVSAEMLDAILAEDWTDPSFDAGQKAAFQFALQYDAGHLINSSVMDAVRAEFDESSIIELAVVCGYYGSVARFAVGFQLDQRR